MKELQKCFGEIYSGEKSISTDVFFILENPRINCHMDAGEFEGLLYNMLSEETFKNQRFEMTDKKDDYTISDYVSPIMCQNADKHNQIWYNLPFRLSSQTSDS